MKTKLFAAATLIILILFSLGCIDNKIDENKLRENIGALLEKYRKGVNTLDRELMKAIVSEKFQTYEIRRDKYINTLFTSTFLIDSISYTNVRVENYKIFTDVTLKCTKIFKPIIKLPLFQDQIPYISGSLKKQTVFSFVYENDGLKLFAEEPLLTTKSFLWGDNKPLIIDPQLSAQEAQPGNIIEIKFNVKKGLGNDVVFAAVNDVLMGTYSLTGYEENNEVSYKLRVPDTLKAGDTFDIDLLAMAGKINMDNPQKAVLQGIALTGYSIPIR